MMSFVGSCVGRKIRIGIGLREPHNITYYRLKKIIDIDAVIAQAKEMLAKEKISPGFKTIIEFMMALFSALINQQWFFVQF